MASRVSTPSEGEIVDSGSDKAKSRSPSFASAVNRQSRRPTIRYSRSPSPTASDYRARGSKRSREDDHYGDSRGGRYRDHHDGYRQGRTDRYRRDSRDRNARRRSRSPPPPPPPRNRDRDRDRPRNRRDEGPGASLTAATEQRRERQNDGAREQSVSNRGNAPSATASSRANAEINKISSQQGTKLHNMDDADSKMAEPEPEPEPDPVDVEALREQKRKRWEAIRAKHRSQSSTPLLVQALDSPASVIPDSTPTTPRSATRSPTPMDFSKDSELAADHEQAGTKDDGPSAADYDPSMDMEEDRLKHSLRFQNGESEDDNAATKQEIVSVEDESAPPKKPKDEFDMFADDDDDDMFADGPTTEPVKKVSKALKVNTMDDWDDEEGYYKVILGELLDGRYHVQSNLGKGMFSGVVRALDRGTDNLVAIKLIRSNETMRKAAAKEIDILEKLKAADMEDKRHLVRLERSFEHKGHLCMVFENLHENLREVLKKFGRDVGIELQAVRIYAQQMFKGLGLLRKCNILHADLKPDNILVNERRNWLKICDLGSASDATENEITPYLVSRFYRAPEIILGMPYDFSIDTWSIGCTLYELFTGKILFTGRSNNQMLKAFMECRGRIPTRMLKRSEFAGLHFDEAGIFRSVEKDKVTGKDVVRMRNFLKPTRDLRSRLSTKGLAEPEAKDMALFIDLLDKCLVLNPERRITPTDALKHPFLTKGRI